jgi:hypothetical protein
MPTMAIYLVCVGLGGLLHLSDSSWFTREGAVMAGPIRYLGSQWDVRTVEQLKQAIQQVWDEVHDHMLSKLMCSMPSRLQRMVDKQGCYIGV